VTAAAATMMAVTTVNSRFISGPFPDNRTLRPATGRG
jgi:hypothetical protein